MGDKIITILAIAGAIAAVGIIYFGLVIGIGG